MDGRRVAVQHSVHLVVFRQVLPDAALKLRKGRSVSRRLTLFHEPPPAQPGTDGLNLRIIAGLPMVGGKVSGEAEQREAEQREAELSARLQQHPALRRSARCAARTQCAEPPAHADAASSGGGGGSGGHGSGGTGSGGPGELGVLCELSELVSNAMRQQGGGSLECVTPTPRAPTRVSSAALEDPLPPPPKAPPPHPLPIPLPKGSRDLPSHPCLAADCYRPSRSARRRTACTRAAARRSTPTTTSSSASRAGIER